MKQKILSLLVLLMTAVTGAWADKDYFYMVISGTSATLKYGSEYTSDNPYLDLDNGWLEGGYYWENKGGLTAVTIDASCNNYNGTSLNGLFSGFSGLTTINGLENLNTANVQDMEYMFADCSSLTSLDLCSFNTASVTTMFNMFARCSSLTTLDLSSWNTAKVGNTYGTFQGCSNLENIYVGDEWTTEAMTYHADMFKGCSKLLSLNTANPVTNKTNAHTGDGGYLKVKPVGDYLFTVAPCEHGSGTVKFFVDEKEVKGANEDDVITMTVTPDEGYVVGSVSANAYTTWAGARRTAPAIPMLGNVTLTPVEGKANTWTFTMPAANVELKIGYLATSNLYLSKDALADKANIAVTAGETAVEFDEVGKSKTTVIEGNTVTAKYNGTKKILGFKAVKKAAGKVVDLSTYSGDSYEVTEDVTFTGTTNNEIAILYKGDDYEVTLDNVNAPKCIIAAWDDTYNINVKLKGTSRLGGISTQAAIITIDEAAAGGTVILDLVGPLGASGSIITINGGTVKAKISDECTLYDTLEVNGGAVYLEAGEGNSAVNGDAEGSVTLYGWNGSAWETYSDHRYLSTDNSKAPTEWTW